MCGEAARTQDLLVQWGVLHHCTKALPPFEAEEILKIRLSNYEEENSYAGLLKIMVRSQQNVFTISD